MIRLLSPALFLFLSTLMLPVTGVQADEGKPTDPALTSAGKLALRITANYVGVPQEQLRLQSLEAVQWEDSSLGCPKPGHRYLPAIANGYKAVVSHGARDYDVHLADGRGLVCEGVLRKGP